MNLLKNLKENWRDIVAALGAAFVFSILNEWAQNLAGKESGWMPLANLVGLLSNIANFLVATMTAWVALAFTWPELNAFMVGKEFDEAVEEMSLKEKMAALMVAMSVMIVGACIVFAR